MKVVVEAGSNLHVFEAIAVSIEEQEINISLANHEIVIVVPISKDERKAVIEQILDGDESVYIKASEIRFSHTLVVVDVGEVVVSRG